jgi:Lrp/AsnC family leucine-responsive transcriptional regulator
MAGRPLDETDEKLLALLEQNARRPVVALAKAVGLSRSAVQDRLARLEDSGAVARYTIVQIGRAHV